MKDWAYYWNKRWMYYVLGKLRSRHSFCYDWLKNDAKSAIHQILRWYSEFKYSRKQTFCQRRYTKNAIFHHSDKIMALNRWGTRTRTRKDRTRICSVANYTIPQTFFVSRFPLDYGCKFTGFFHIYQTKVHFFWKKSLLLQNIPAKCPILSIFHLKIIIHHGCSAILHGCSTILHDHHFETISSRNNSIKCANRHWKRNCGQFPEFS